MKVLLIGSTGNIGSIVYKSLKKILNQNSIFAPSSDMLNLRNKDSIDRYLKNICKETDLPFDFLIYCAFDKLSNNIFDQNLENLQNLLHFKDDFVTWIHISSRAVYDGLNSFQDIQTIPIKDLPLPNKNQYSLLKYREEQILNQEIIDRCIIFRLFDITKYDNFDDIQQRWENQIKSWGFCRNEILSPFNVNGFNPLFEDIISGRIFAGTYNLCGLKKINSAERMNNYGKTHFQNGPTVEKTGKMIFR